MEKKLHHKTRTLEVFSGMRKSRGRLSLLLLGLCAMQYPVQAQDYPGAGTMVGITAPDPFNKAVD